MENNELTSPISKIKGYFPINLILSLNAADKNIINSISEIRLRADKPVSLTIDSENYFLAIDGNITKTVKRYITVTSNDIENFIFRFCSGSVYSFADTIKEGYITRYGIRVGLSGFTAQTGKDIETISKITSVNIRIPHHIKGASKSIVKLLENEGFCGGGILVVSPPGDGKTTFLRDLAIELSSGINIDGKDKRFRISIIDERNEIYIPEFFSECLVDVLENCKKPKGIEIATRVLSPEIIICDEIGSESEAIELKKAHTGGVILIASVHSDSLETLSKKEHLYELILSGVFKRCIFLKRNKDKIICEAVKIND